MDQTIRSPHLPTNHAAATVAVNSSYPATGYPKEVIFPGSHGSLLPDSQMQLYPCFAFTTTDAEGVTFPWSPNIYPIGNPMKPDAAGALPITQGSQRFRRDRHDRTLADQTTGYDYSPTALRLSLQEPGQDNAVASLRSIHGSFQAPTQDITRSPSAHTEDRRPNHQGVRCRWEGCNSSTIFRREADILRHLRTIHVSPKAYPCPEWGCNKAFGRKDHLRAHRRKCHGQ